MDGSENEGGTKPLEFWLQDLERRMAFVQPEHTVRGMFFRGMLESFRSLGDETLVGRCLEASGHERFVDFFSYSVRVQSQLLLTALPTLARHYGSGEAALRQVGRRSISDFLGSVTGKAMLMMAHGRPRPMIDHMPTGYRVAVSFGEMKVAWSGPQRGTLSVGLSFLPPPVYAGMLQGVLEASRVQTFQAAGRETEGLGVACDFSWE
ncbi:uncharacterized protein (TIGR02265 family) [Archangium gephyra]|uniref:Uncharacterized protein (TIGR02265 family) n=1 Tax=Archangium gephyra TaxID=48 RepID=A0AAC8Q9K5_9BACT|nr:DUF2378 family protein [Archangium gephyra]AKJ03284.1 Hypothetical protein AA314_04910 [Archangium gephyra]REG22848.1 uncharacterized protein (TIGR02265 family) [Archangium gephyra]